MRNKPEQAGSKAIGSKVIGSNVEPNTKMIGTMVPESLWRAWRIACMVSGRNQKDVLRDMIRNFVETSTEEQSTKKRK